MLIKYSLDLDRSYSGATSMSLRSHINCTERFVGIFRCRSDLQILQMARKGSGKLWKLRKIYKCKSLPSIHHFSVLSTKHMFVPLIFPCFPFQSIQPIKMLVSSSGLSDKSSLSSNSNIWTITLIFMKHKYDSSFNKITSQYLKQHNTNPLKNIIIPINLSYLANTTRPSQSLQYSASTKNVVQKIKTKTEFAKLNFKQTQISFIRIRNSYEPSKI